MTDHEVGTREEWLRARKQLLEREQELTRRSDELARQRRELPWVHVEREYTFETDEGKKTLAELFERRSQLLVYLFMFGAKYTAGCPMCSAAADIFEGAVAHLKARDVTFLCASRAPLEKLQSYKRRMGCTTSCSTGRRRDGSTTFEPSATTSTRRTPPNREHARV